jgi:type II secretory pathway component PulK
MRRRKGEWRKRQKGMTLAIVLSGLVILAMISVTLLSRADRDVTSGATVVDRAKAAAFVEGAIDASILALFAPDTRNALTRSDGALEVSIAGTRMTTHVRDVCGLWDLNHGQIAVFTRLLENLGAPDPALTADALSTARGVETGLLSRQQIRSLPGIDTGLYQRLSKEVTVNCRADRIDPGFASAILLSAIPNMSQGQVDTIIEQRRDGGVAPDLLASHADYLAPGPGQTYEISATHALGPGSRIFRRAEVTLTHHPSEPYRILAWVTAE